MIDPDNTGGNNSSGGEAASSGGGLSNFFKNMSFEGLGSLIGLIAGGSGALAGGRQPKVGYQGGIPSLTAVRERIPYEQMEQEGRRAGSGGRRYFTDTVYAQTPEGTTGPTLEQAQQQVADQQSAILNQQTYTPPSYVGATSGGGGGQQQSQQSFNDIFKQIMDQYVDARRDGGGSDNAGVSGGSQTGSDAGVSGGSQTGSDAGVSGGSGITTGADLGGMTLGGSPMGGLPDKFSYASPKYNFQTGKYETGAPVWYGAGDTPDEDSLAALLEFQNRYSPDMEMPSFQTREPRFAQGGIASLDPPQGYYLGGMTDGMADEVPANIEGTQPAALSDGEFVVPADVVSHLGNGNSNAGARQLYEMMERIRKARTGNSEQGREINPSTMMPR